MFNAAMGFFLGVWVSIFYLVSIVTPDYIWQQQATERGYALYCPDNGKFAWKGECKND